MPDVSVRVFLFALGVAIATSLLFGLAPAWQASRARPAEALKENSASVAGGVGLRKVLVTSQIALAVVLLIGAGLFVRTLAALRAQGPGFQTTNLLRFRIDPGMSGYTAERSKRLTREILAALRSSARGEERGLVRGGLAERSQLGQVPHDRVRQPPADRRKRFTSIGSAPVSSRLSACRCSAGATSMSGTPTTTWISAPVRQL